MSVEYPYDRYPITHPQGTRFALTLDRSDAEGTYRNFATDTVRGAIRRYYDDEEPQATFVCTPVDHPVTGNPNEAIEIVIDAVEMELSPGNYVYAIEVVPGLGAEYVFPFIGGSFTVTPWEA